MAGRAVAPASFAGDGTAAPQRPVAAKQTVKPIAEAAGVSPEMLQQRARAYLQSTNPDPTKISPHEAQKD